MVALRPGSKCPTYGSRPIPMYTHHNKARCVSLLRSAPLFPGVSVAGGLHGGGHGGVPDHRAVLQRGPALGRDEHQRRLVPAGARLRHVSLYQWLFTIII